MCPSGLSSNPSHYSYSTDTNISTPTRNGHQGKQQQQQQQQLCRNKHHQFGKDHTAATTNSSTSIRQKCKKIVFGGQFLLTQLFIGAMFWAFIPMMVLQYHEKDIDLDVHRVFVSKFLSPLSAVVHENDHYHSHNNNALYERLKQHQQQPLQMVGNIQNHPKPENQQQQQQVGRKNEKHDTNVDRYHHPPGGSNRQLLRLREKVTNTLKDKKKNDDIKKKTQSKNDETETEKKEIQQGGDNSNEKSSSSNANDNNNNNNKKSHDETKRKTGIEKPVQAKSNNDDSSAVSKNTKKKTKSLRSRNDDKAKKTDHQAAVSMKKEEEFVQQEEKSKSSGTTLLTPKSLENGIIANKEAKREKKGATKKKEQKSGTSSTSSSNVNTRNINDQTFSSELKPKSKGAAQPQPLFSETHQDDVQNQSNQQPQTQQEKKEPYSSKLRVIVTGMEHTGTTVLSELIMSAPGLNGPFETGFLLSPTPSDFVHQGIFYEWLSRDDIRNAFLELQPNQIETLVKLKTHADMYDYVLKESKFFQDSPISTEWYVDKTPQYVYNLCDVLERAPPDVKVVVSAKSYEHTKLSWVTHWKENEHYFERQYALYQQNLKDAQAKFPNRIYVQNYEDFIGKYSEGDAEGATKAGQSLFQFLDLEWKDSYLTGKAFKEKGSNCNLCHLRKL